MVGLIPKSLSNGLKSIFSLTYHQFDLYCCSSMFIPPTTIPEEDDDEVVPATKVKKSP